MKDINYIVDILEEIVNIPSPSGYTKQVMERIEKEVAGFGFSSAYNRKGGMLITGPNGDGAGTVCPRGYARSHGAFHPPGRNTGYRVGGRFYDAVS